MSSPAQKRLDVTDIAKDLAKSRDLARLWLLVAFMGENAMSANSSEMAA